MARKVRSNFNNPRVIRAGGFRRPTSHFGDFYSVKRVVTGGDFGVASYSGIGDLFKSVAKVVAAPVKLVASKVVKPVLKTTGKVVAAPFKLVGSKIVKPVAKGVAKGAIAVASTAGKVVGGAVKGVTGGLSPAVAAEAEVLPAPVMEDQVPAQASDSQIVGLSRTGILMAVTGVGLLVLLFFILKKKKATQITAVKIPARKGS